MECDNNNDIGNASVKALDNKLCSEACLPGEWQSAEHELCGCREVGGKTSMPPTLNTYQLPGGSKQHMTFVYMHNYTARSSKQQEGCLAMASFWHLKPQPLPWLLYITQCRNKLQISQLLGEFLMRLSPKNPGSCDLFFLRAHNIPPYIFYLLQPATWDPLLIFTVYILLWTSPPSFFLALILSSLCPNLLLFKD